MNGRTVALACVLVLVVAAPASADSIVYVKEGNVWLASADGTGQLQVTRDGDADHPYRSPSQADDGTIAAGFANEIVGMRQNGEVLNRIDPPALLDSASDPVDGPPVSVAISPDGTRIAYTMADYACPEGADCDTRTVTAYTAADRLTPPGAGGITYLRNPSWATNSRTLQFGGFTHQVDLHDVGADADVHWFDDSDIVGQAEATDLGDGEINSQGTRLALIRGYGEDAALLWYDVSGDALHGSAPPPAPRCGTTADPGISSPTWSPDGESLAFADPEGIWVKTDVGSCDDPQPVLAIPGGAHPDWGPAAIAPGPLTGRDAKPAAMGCAAAKGVARDRCRFHNAVDRCRKARGAARTRCIARARRAYAIARCKDGTKGVARVRCLAKARRVGRPSVRTRDRGETNEDR